MSNSRAFNSIIAIFVHKAKSQAKKKCAGFHFGYKMSANLF